MKKYMIIILGSICLIGLTGCGNKPTEVSSSMDNSCNHKAEFLIKQEDRKIYTYCLNDVKIEINDKEEDLKSFIKNEENAIDKIIDTLEFKSSYDDGGTEVYKGENLTLIKCNTIDGNRDIFIGDENMEFKSNFCSNNIYTYVRTYTVKSFKKYTKQQYTDDGIPVTYASSYEVELYQFQGETQKVIINNYPNLKLEKDKTYEFELQLYEDTQNIDDTIEDIFKYSDIIEIRETDKEGLDQLQEPMTER